MTTDLQLECQRCGITGTPDITERSGQHVARCGSCQEYIKCVSPDDLGMERRTVRSRSHIKPKLRAKVLERSGYACAHCGRLAPDVVLHVDHIIPVELAKRYDVYDQLIESDLNMLATCEECNLGKGAAVFGAGSVRLMYRALWVAHIHSIGDPTE